MIVLGDPVSRELVTTECLGSAGFQVFLTRVDGGSEFIHFRDVTGLSFLHHSQAGSQRLAPILITH